MPCEGLAWERRKFSQGLLEKTGKPPTVGSFVLYEVGDESFLLSMNQEGEGRGKQRGTSRFEIVISESGGGKLTGKHGAPR